MRTRHSSRHTHRALPWFAAAASALAVVAVRPAEGAVLKGVQTGELTIPAAGVSNTAPITAVTTTQAILFVSMREDEAQPDEGNVTCELSAATTILCQRQIATARSVTIRYQVAEFSSGVTVQRGTTNVSPTANVMIAPVTLSRAFIVLGGMRRVGPDTQWNFDDFVRAQLTSATNLELTFGLGDQNVHWQVVSFDTASVQRGLASFPDGDTLLDVTLPVAVDPSRTFLLYSDTTGSASATPAVTMVLGRLLNSTTLRFTKSSGFSGFPKLLSYEVVSVPYAVQHAVTSFGAGVASLPVAISRVNTAGAVAFSGYQSLLGQGAGGTSQAVSGSAVGVSSFTHEISSATTLTLTRANTSAASEVGWFVVDFMAPVCCTLNTAEVPGSTVTVTAPNSFEMRFNRAVGGGADLFYDLEEDPGRAQNLSGTVVDEPTLFHMGLRGGPGDLWHETDKDTQAKLDLLEATPVRVRVRKEAKFVRDPSITLGGLSATGDYSVSGMGRMALAWTMKSADPALSYLQRTLDFSTHWNSTTSPGFKDCAQGAGCSPFGSNDGQEDFLLQAWDIPGKRTDFLAILSEDWAQASYFDSFGFAGASQYWYMSWHEVSVTQPVPALQSWKLLSYFKPTNLVDDVDPAVTARSNDYRGPSATPVAVGAGWVDANENTASDPANVFFNEAEAAYVLDLNQASGLTFDMDGSTTTRYSPFFKIRQWRSFTAPPSITVEGVTKTRGIHYVAAVKPVSRAAFAKDILWHSTLQVALAVSPNQDIGSTGGISNGVAYVAARYGQGASVTADNQYVSFPVTDGAGALTGNFNGAKGAIEFWYRPSWNHDDGVRHDLGGMFLDASNMFVLQKLVSNALLFRISVGGVDYDCSVTSADYSWRANDWVHLRFEWDDSPASGPEQRIVINQAVPTQACLGNFTFPGGPFPPDIDFRFGDINNGAGSFGAGVYDEIYSFGGSSTTPTPLANGGLPTPGREYLGDAAQNYQLTFVTREDVTFRGPRLFVGSDSKFLGLNIALAIKGVSADANLRIHYWNGMAWSILSDTNPAFWVPGFSDTSNSLRQNGTMSWTEALVPNWAPYSVNGGPDLYYIRIGQQFGTYTTPPTEALITTDILLFQYCADVTAAAQTFVFGVPPTTEVKLSSFSALPGDASVTLEWRTASELQNQGFHVYRAASEGGPWTRLTSSLIPGLGSSAVGQAYSYRDAGLVNGTRYFYRLEDVDASSKTTSHGPVSAVPVAGAAGAAPGSEPAASGAKKKGASAPSCPDWVMAAYGSMAGASASSAALTCTRHGDPEAVSLAVVSRDSRQATLELRTGGFYALHEATGKVRVFVPGFDFPQDSQAAALPFRRALVDAVVGRRAQLGGVRALDPVGFKGLVPASLGALEMQLSRDGTVRAGRRAVRESARPRVFADLARLLPSVFQGETKSAVVEIMPLRYDARRQQLVLSKRVRVKLLFTGRETGESGRGRFGRRERPEKPLAGELLARLHTTGRGLHAVSFEQLFPGRQQGLASSQLRLERQGQAQGLHLEPASDRFGPGSVLYFYADTEASSTDFSSETAWELWRARDGLPMPLVSATPSGGAVSTASTGRASFEVNRFYQPGLLEAEDLWLWEALGSGVTRAKSFSLSGVDASSAQTAEVEVFLQGASESGIAIDHHVSVSLNATPVGAAQFAGKKPYRMSLRVPASLLREGANELQLTNVADTGVSSFVFLDRFTIAHPQVSSLAGGRFAGWWAESGSVSVSASGAVSGPVRIVDVTATVPVWLSGFEHVAGTVRFRAEAGHRYWVGSDSALFSPRVSPAEPSGLKSAANQADYILIAPRAFLAAAEPLLQRRADQGLQARAVAFEEIADEFGHGQPSAEAIRGFLAYAFQSWARPSPRYVLLLGDSSYDPRNFIGTSQPSPLPALWAKTSYLWTVSDPQLAAVNGEDTLPDLAIGRLPATTLEQAESLVQKLVAWEESGHGLSGNAALVADNPDLAGDFEANVRDIAQSYLADRSPSLLLLSEHGAGLRGRIAEALDGGLGYLGYAGHGGAAVWASENVWNSWDAASLQAQSKQPLLVTMNCLNGYFVAPAFDSLAESLLKADGRGAIAAFSPSGLSLDGPAHQYHRALAAELTGGTHQRLGDALLAAQKAYAATGLMPELLSIYHLLGDPAMVIR